MSGNWRGLLESYGLDDLCGPRGAAVVAPIGSVLADLSDVHVRITSGT
jgi:hypothetical protein